MVFVSKRGTPHMVYAFGRIQDVTKGEKLDNTAPRMSILAIRCEKTEEKSQFWFKVVEGFKAFVMPEDDFYEEYERRPGSAMLLGLNIKTFMEDMICRKIAQ